MSVKLAGVAPVLPVRSVGRALEHYAAIELHLARVRELDPAQNSSACYLYVDDANALHDEWRAAAVAGRLTDPEDTPYGLRELAHVDGDGNLLRVGSNLRR